MDWDWDWDGGFGNMMERGWPGWDELDIRHNLQALFPLRRF